MLKFRVQYLRRSTAHLSSPQALETEVWDRIRERTVMSEKLKDKQEEIQKTLRNLDREVKLRYG